LRRTVILSSVDRKVIFGARVQGLELAEWLMKPVKQHVLHDCLLSVPK
jgi:hypothetical protein